MKVFKEGAEKVEGGSMQSKLSRFLIKYCTTPHSITGVAPAQLLMMKKIRTRLDLQYYNNTGGKVRLKHGYQKYTHDYHTKDASNPVFLKDFNSNSSKSWQTGTRACTTGPASALVKLLDRLEV